jgi:DNA-binding MarR family transcriptional regulator
MRTDQQAKRTSSTHLSWKLKDIHHQQANLAQLALNTIGLHFGQPRILFTIAHLQGASQKEIADRLHVTPASLATSLKRLQKAGFLARSIDDHDQRINKIELTEKGHRVIRICKLQMDSIDQLMQRNFSPEEQDQLISFLDRLSANLTQTTVEEIDAVCRTQAEYELEHPESSEVNV